MEHKNKTKRKVLKLLNIKDINIMPQTKIINYIIKLHRFIKSQNQRFQVNNVKLKKLHYKYKQKLNSSVNTNKEQNIEKSTYPSADTNRQITEVNANEKPNDFIANIQEAAERAQENTDFVYEPTSGLYYDFKSGYYYNAEHGLYYDGNTGCYYIYDQDNNTFEFHSQIPVQSKAKKKKKKHKNVKNISPLPPRTTTTTTIVTDNSTMSDNDTIMETIRINDDDNDDDDGANEKITISNTELDDKMNEDDIVDLTQEDGEIISDGECGESINSNETDSWISNSNDISKHYPPCLRIIVQETNLTKLKIGALFVLTIKGGTLGREGEHEVIIPDINISKYHLKISYDDAKAKYECIDLGSRNGTLLNGIRMSCAKQESDPLEIFHGSVIQLSQTKLLCHIHYGNNTCNYCEPGLISVNSNNNNNIECYKKIPISHKEGLKNIKKKYGLESDQYIDHKIKGKDRSAIRRKLVGSHCEHEKTDYSSVDRAISKENVGFKIMSKLGWKDGEKLGKNDNGLLTPISCHSNEDKKGFGSFKSTIAKESPIKKQKLMINKLTKERFANCCIQSEENTIENMGENNSDSVTNNQNVDIFEIDDENIINDDKVHINNDQINENDDKDNENNGKNNENHNNNKDNENKGINNENRNNKDNENEKHNNKGNESEYKINENYNNKANGNNGKCNETHNQINEINDTNNITDNNNKNENIIEIK